MRVLWLDTESRAAGAHAPYGGSGNLLFLPALTAPFYSPGWITEGMALTAWFTDLCPSTTLLLSAKLNEHDVVQWESASCSVHICSGKSAKDIHHPHTLTCAYRCRAALFSVTDVSFAVPNPHFPSISNGQVSVCAALDRPFQGTSDQQRQKSPSPAQRTSYDIAERFRGYYNFLSKWKKGWDWGFMGKVIRALGH